MSGGPIPEDLLRAVESDLRPVRPLPAAWRRAIWAVAAVTAVCLLSLATAPLRSDLGALPMWLSWGSSLLELLFGLGLVTLALRESIPGNAIPRGATSAVMVAAMVLQITVGIATWLHSPGIAVGNALTTGMGCMAHDSLMALPAFAVTLWLIFRALPVRAGVAGLMGGAGAAMTADAISHLLCPYSDLRHVLVWHTGTIVLFMILGWAAGEIWGRRRWRR